MHLAHAMVHRLQRQVRLQHLQRGQTWPTPRFTDNSDGTVTDNLTGLIWLKNANASGGTRSWADALADVAELNASGTMNSNASDDTSNGGSHQTDWCLPSVKELQSLIDFGNVGPALPSGHPFEHVQSSSYCPGTTYADNTGYVWHVTVTNGNLGYGSKTFTSYVWPVRAGN